MGRAVLASLLPRAGHASFASLFRVPHRPAGSQRGAGAAGCAPESSGALMCWRPAGTSPRWVW
eukprot:260117-Pyramimonas_sp.AAC.1